MRNRRFYRPWGVSAAARLLTACAFSACARAADVQWSNPAGGNITDNANWSGGAAPGSADNAVFDLGSSSGYTVTVQDDQQITTNQLSVDTDNVTLNFADNGVDPASYNLTAPTNSLVVGEYSGDNAQLRLLTPNSNNGQLGLYANQAVIGDQAGSTGTLIVGSTTPLAPQNGPLLEVSGPVIVGNAGAGSMQVDTGLLSLISISSAVPYATTGPLTVGNLSGSTGTVTLGGFIYGGVTGVLQTNGNADIAAMPGSTGTVTDVLGQWLVNGDINVGGTESAPGGTAVLNVGSFIFTSAVQTPSTNALRLYPGGTVNLQGGALSVGYLDYQGGTINFEGGELDIAQNLDIGASGDFISSDYTLAGGTLSVAGNTNFDTHQFIINGGSFSTGTLSFSHGGSIVMETGTLALTNSGLDVSPGGPLGANLNIGQLANYQISGATTIAKGSTVCINGGELVTSDVVGAGKLKFNSGLLMITGDLDLAAGQPLGTNLCLTAAFPDYLVVNANTTIPAGSTLTLNGGSFSTGTLSVVGTLNFESGQLELTNSGLTVGVGSLLGPNLTIPSSQSLSVSGTTTFQPGNTLTIAGGTFTTGALQLDGQVNFQAGTFGVNNLEIGPAGPLGGNVSLDSSKTVNVTGITTVDQGSTLSINGGTLFTGTLAGTGNLNFSSGSLTITNDLFFAEGPLPTTLSLGPASQLSVYGTTTLVSGQALIINGGSFNTGSLTGLGHLDLISGGVQIYNGSFEIGAGAMGGPTLTLGNTATLYVGQEMTVDPGAILTMTAPSLQCTDFTTAGHLAFGLDGKPGSASGSIGVSDYATIAGTLDIYFLNSSLSATGDSFEILTDRAGLIGGYFSNAPQDSVFAVDGRLLQIAYSVNDVTLTDIGAELPEPIGLPLGITFTGLLLARRRRALV